MSPEVDARRKYTLEPTIKPILDDFVSTLQSMASKFGLSCISVVNICFWYSKNTSCHKKCMGGNNLAYQCNLQSDVEYSW